VPINCGTRPPEIKQFDGASKENWWEAPPVFNYRPRHEEPDFWALAGTTTFAMTAQLTESLGGFLHPIGELLPIRFIGRDEEFVPLNVTNAVDCLDPEFGHTHQSARFVEHRLPGSGLFKVPQLDRETLYLERDDDDERLRECIDERGLRGLVFTPVWSSRG